MAAGCRLHPAAARCWAGVSRGQRRTLSSPRFLARAGAHPLPSRAGGVSKAAACGVLGQLQGRDRGRGASSALAFAGWGVGVASPFFPPDPAPLQGGSVLFFTTPIVFPFQRHTLGFACLAVCHQFQPMLCAFQSQQRRGKLEIVPNSFVSGLV